MLNVQQPKEIKMRSDFHITARMRLKFHEPESQRGKEKEENLLTTYKFLLVFMNL